LSGPQAADEDLFNAAQNEYLKGNWYEAEVALNRLLDRNLLDVEARLMLASVLRRTGRRDEAAAQIARLGRTDGAERWHLEIARLKQRIADDESEPANDSPVAVDESATAGEAMQQAA
jgi:hypothetical protein